MSGRFELAVPVKLWALFCALACTSLTADPLLLCVPAAFGFAHAAVQRNWRLVRSFGLFYLLLALLLLGIRFQGLRMPVFSEFHVLLFWTLSPVFLVAWDLIVTPPGELSAFLSRLHAPTGFILGLLVTFRFFPTMKTELAAVGRSMRNRRLAEPERVLGHPVASCEYVLIPLLLRCLQVADQLAASAVARGAGAPGVRGSYGGRPPTMRDGLYACLWTVGTACFLVFGGVRL